MSSKSYDVIGGDRLSLRAGGSSRDNYHAQLRPTRNSSCIDHVSNTRDMMWLRFPEDRDFVTKCRTTK